MGKRTQKSTQVTENTFAPWAQNLAQSNLNYADALTSGVLNRYNGGVNATPGVPTSFIPEFSKDTNDAFEMARRYATGSTPGDIRTIAGDVGGYRNKVARFLDASDPTNAAATKAFETYRQLADRQVPTAPAFSNLVADEYAAQNIQASQVGAVNDIAARQGASMMNSYLDPYLAQVVDTSLADYDVGVDRQSNVNRARRDAASAFGDRAALADAVYSADSNRGRGSLASGLRSQAFNTAASYGMQDANRFLDADRTNQSVALQRAMENAQLQQAAAIANANWAQNAAKDNTDGRNDFKVKNDARLSNLNQTQFDNQTAVNTQRAAAADALLSSTADYQADQLKMAEGLTGLAGKQIGYLNDADESEQKRIAAQTAVGQAIDEHNKAVLREPLEMLDWRAKLLSETPYPKTTTVNSTQKMSGIEALKGVGDFLGNYAKLSKFEVPKELFKFPWST